MKAPPAGKGTPLRGGIAGTVALALLAGLPFMSIGCTRRAEEAVSTAQPPLTAALFEQGLRLYKRQCAVCHGAEGAGDGPAAYLLYPRPRDFTQNEFRLVSTTSMQATEEDLFLTITRGMPGSAMPSWETLTPTERWAVVYYVRHLAEGDPPGEIEADSLIQVPSEPPRSPQGIGRGRALFTQACASCHGLQGRGDGRQVMADNAGFPIKPSDLTAGIFKGSSESKDLYCRIVAGLPGSPMPSYAGVYTDEQIWDLVHYVQSLVPPGAEERVRMRRHTVRARRVRGELPLEPTAQAWKAVEPAYVALAPLWWRDRRVEGVEVKALHDGKELALLLAWKDETSDDATLTPQAFSDAAAVQFSMEKDPPFFGMGDAQGAVQIWFWKASWQRDLEGWRDVETAYPQAAVDWYEAQRTYRHGERFEVSEARTTEQDPALMGGWGAGNPLSDPQRTSAAEEAVAKGPGTFTSRPPKLQRVQAKGIWQQGQWWVVLKGPLSSNKGSDPALRPGQGVSVAFAVWDGDAEDRNGQKSVSVWNPLSLER